MAHSRSTRPIRPAHERAAHHRSRHRPPHRLTLLADDCTHLIRRVAILGTGLIGGSFALALRKYTTDIYISGWDRPDVARPPIQWRLRRSFLRRSAAALRTADLIFIALPIGVTLDLLPELARSAPAER